MAAVQTQGGMEIGLYANNFSRAFSDLLDKTGVTCYRISQFTGLDEGYLSRLRNGEKCNPSVETIVEICLALAHFSNRFHLPDAESLANSVGRSLTRKRSRQYA